MALGGKIFISPEGQVVRVAWIDADLRHGVDDVLGFLVKRIEGENGVFLIKGRVLELVFFQGAKHGSFLHIVAVDHQMGRWDAQVAALVQKQRARGVLLAGSVVGQIKGIVPLQHRLVQHLRDGKPAHHVPVLLAQLLEDIEKSDLTLLGKTGFDAPEIDQLYSKLHDKEVHEDNFDIDSELKQPVFSREGDLWLIGKHRVLCGDSTGEEVYTRLMDGQKANLVLTDPPYGVDVEETAGKIQNDNLPDEQFDDFLLSAFRCMHSNLADDGSIYVWHADTKGLIFRKAYQDAGFYLSGCCIWKKDSLVLGRSPYQWIHEPCLFGWKQKGKHQWYSDRKQTTVWEYPKPKSSPDHPTTKPVTLMSYPIKNSTMTNGVVLDPFLGSGSTLIACMQTDRICRGIELDPKFVDVIVKRAIAENQGKYDDVFVIRDGQKLRFDEVAAFEPEVAGDEK